MSQHLCYVWLLPLLESPYASVAANLPNALAGLDIRQPLPEAVELRQLLLTALESDSEYWAQRAVTWLEEGFPLDRELCETLLHQVSRKRFSQSIRHRLTPLGKRWLRQHSQAR
ncbi:hypothetical protein [Pseudomonas sp. Au-Pse12]|uniref:hypothetical protein n=1 Tax=Pseudomonas sp. Au-Pse12 TaxID=2906459 RepID=UPI001E3105C9|nr:hypothetical protein [Pseudomonas sp. Au-Pse12]MCE4057844.1 hypothetical protein [Pseudomonas sp. Au-Pse12]